MPNGPLTRYAASAIAAVAAITPFTAAAADIDRTENRYFVEQDEQIHPGFARHGIRTDMLMVTASYVSARPSLSWEEFTQIPDHEIARALQAYREDRLGWTVEQAREFTGVVVLDIEGEAMPNAWRFIRGTVQATDGRLDRYYEFLDAYARRIEVAKRDFPNAQIGVWNPVKAPHNGNTPPSFLEAVDVVVEAAAYGVFDGADFLCPRLYPGWGTADFDGNTARLHRNYRQYAANTLQQSQRIRRSDGSPFYVVPVLGFVITNPCGNNGTPGYTCSTQAGSHLLDPYVDPELDDTLGIMIEELRSPTHSANGFGDQPPAPADGYAFWVHQQTFSARAGEYTPTADDYWDALFCRGDFDADGALTINDVVTYLELFTEKNPSADWNRDNDINVDDILGFILTVRNGCE